MSTAVVVPVFRNAATVAELARRLADAFAAAGVPWTLRLVVDACPEGSAEVVARLEAADRRVRATYLHRNVGQHRAIATGLAAERRAEAWVCLDGDLQDPPEAVPQLVAALAARGASGVFAGRRGSYESWGRQVTGTVHRRALRVLTGLPADAGAFLAMDRRLRDAVVDTVLVRGAPSVVLAAARSGLPLVSTPVRRDVRLEGTSAWTSGARLEQSLRTLVWAARREHPRAGP